jgi:hypothetical protein
VDAEPLEVEDGVRRGGDLQLTTVAAPGVHLADVEGTAEASRDPVAQLRRRFLQAVPRQRLHRPERGPAGSSIDVETGALRELLARVRSLFELASRTDRALGARLDTLAALDAEGVGKGKHLAIGRRALHLQSSRGTCLDALVTGGAELEVDHRDPEGRSLRERVLLGDDACLEAVGEDSEHPAS